MVQLKLTKKKTFYQYDFEYDLLKSFIIDQMLLK